MSSTLSRFAGLSRAKRLVLAAALAVVSLGAFAGVASASFTLTTGTIHLTAGSTTGAPPSGSWVSLPTDDPRAVPPYFENPSSTWTGTPTDLYTLIQDGNSATGPRLGVSSPGLELGQLQGAYGITGDLTDPFNTVPFYLYSRAATPTSNPGWLPKLTFTGSATATGTRALTSGDLDGLWVNYNGNDYYVGTDSSAGTGRIAPLTGSITGNATRAGATITLNWNTDLASPYAPGFEAYEAKFQLSGSYTP